MDFGERVYKGAGIRQKNLGQALLEALQMIFPLERQHLPSESIKHQTLIHKLPIIPVPDAPLQQECFVERHGLRVLSMGEKP
jgi:hypothetical protein